MKEINLMDIICENASIYNNNIEVDEALAAMRIACEQALELAAENAKIKRKRTTLSSASGSEYHYKNIIDKQSILDTINQVK